MSADHEALTQIASSAVGLFNLTPAGTDHCGKIADAIIAAGFTRSSAAKDEGWVATNDWQCPHCGSDKDPWFDRCLDEHGNITDRCQDCGKDANATSPRQFEAMANELAKRINENVRLADEVKLFRTFADAKACKNVDNAPPSPLIAAPMREGT